MCVCASAACVCVRARRVRVCESARERERCVCCVFQRENVCVSFYIYPGGDFPLYTDSCRCRAIENTVCTV